MARSASVVASEPWNAKRPASMKPPADAEDARLGRLVEIEAARVVAGQDAEGFDRDVGPLVEAERLAAVLACSDRGRPAAGDRPAADSRRCRSGDRWHRCRRRRNASTEMRMKVAEAMTAIASTLRPGRSVVLRKPRRAIEGTLETCPAARKAPGQEAQARDEDGRAGAEEGARRRRSLSPRRAAINPRPSTAKYPATTQSPPVRLRRLRCAVRLRLMAQAGARSSPANRLRSEIRAQTAQRPPDAAPSPRRSRRAAPATSEIGDTCSVSAVVPTAPDHQRAQAGHHQRRRSRRRRPCRSRCRSPRAAVLPRRTGGARAAC